MASSHRPTKSPEISWTDTECYYEIVERILKETSPAFLTKFESLNSNKDRFSFVDSNKKITELLSTQLRNINILKSKSNRSAELHRSKGNKFFKSGEFLKALEEYNKCIVYSRTDHLEEYKRKVLNNTSDSFENSSLENSGGENSNELALGLGNRSVILLKLSRFSECIDDVKDSLNSGYPSTQKYKLLERMAACQEQLDHLCSAIEYFQMAKKSIEQSDLNETQRATQKKLIETNIDRCNKKKNELKSQQKLTNSKNFSSCKGIERNCDKLKSDQSPERSNTKDDLIKSLQKKNPLPKLSDGSIRFEYSSEVGKHAVASRDIKTGEVVMIDETFAKVLTQSDMEDHCYYCFSKLCLQWDQIYSCFTCVFAKYCSKNCLRLSYILHRHDLECPLLSKWIFSKTGPMPWLVVRLLLSIGKDKWMDILQPSNMIDSTKDVDEHSRQEDCSDHSVSESQNEFDENFRKVAFQKNVLSVAPKLYNLVSHSDKRQPAELFQYSLLALWTVLLLDEIKFFEDIQFPEENSKLTNNKISTKEMKSHQSRTIIGGMALKFVQIISCNGIEITSMSLNDTLSKCHPQCFGVALYPKVSLFNHSCDPDLELLFVKDVCVARSIRPISKGSPVNIDYGFLFYSSPKSIRQDHLMKQYFFQCQCRACFNNWNVKKDLLKDSDIFQPVVMAEDKSRTQCPICFAHSMEDFLKEIENGIVNSNVDVSVNDVKKEEIQKKSKKRRKKIISNSDIKTSNHLLTEQSQEQPHHESMYESEKCHERRKLCKCVSCEMVSCKSTVELLKSMNCKLEDVLRNVGKMKISSNDIKYLELYLDVRYFSTPKHVTQELVSGISTLKQIYRLLGNNNK